MQPNPTAGGFFLVAPILIGFFAGLATGDAMRGVLIGTAIGIALLGAVWLLDRRRGG
jgi:mannose/fructose/N-acetylgalactosamine-specific phosphotransferase system component IIC